MNQVYLWLLAWLGLLLISTGSTHADGCFVFRWNKDIDIQEPTQKAIMVFDGGREELLLQVKYEGPLEEFGWLIPVPSLPEVERGSMEPFYELSRITQMDVHSNIGMSTRGESSAGGGDSVQVVQVKTVGAYHVSVLSATDSRSLGNWLKSHEYSIPPDRNGIVEDYIRMGWYFVAVKIELNGERYFRKGPDSAAKKGTPSRQALRVAGQLAGGELHPLRMRFATPRCVFPLSISAITGKPSEVSLYVLSTRPLLNPFIYQEALDRFRNHRDRYEMERAQSESKSIENAQTASGNDRQMDLAIMMLDSAPNDPRTGRKDRDWTYEEIRAMAEEETFPSMDWDLEDHFFTSSYSLLHCRPIPNQQMPACSREFSLLTNASWFLTKQVRTFQPEEMRDLYFEPAVPLLAQVLSEPKSGTVAGLLSHLGPEGETALKVSIQSTNSEERLNALKVFSDVNDPAYGQALEVLLHDVSPKIRYAALSQLSEASHWKPAFRNTVVSLLHDEQWRIRQAAAFCLHSHDRGDQSDLYPGMFQAGDPEIQVLVLWALTAGNVAAIPREELVRLLGSPHSLLVRTAMALLSRASGGRLRLLSREAEPMTTNALSWVRVMGLAQLRRNGDSVAIDFALPLTRDSTPLLRRRAFELLRYVTGENLSTTDSAEWERWWVANKVIFSPNQRKTASDGGFEVADIESIRTAAEDGNVEAQLTLGGLYYNGSGLAQDVSEARKWYQRAADQGCVQAFYYLGLACETMGPSHASEALRSYRKAAHQGYGRAQVRLAEMYDRGEKVPQDHAEAYIWYRKAAEYGIGRALYGAGRLCFEGKGVPKNHKKAATWLRKAAEQGIADAQSLLGRMYRDGDGVGKDLLEAYRWLELAAMTRDMGSVQSPPSYAEVRDQLRKQLTPEQLAEAQRRVEAFVPKKEVKE